MATKKQSKIAETAHAELRVADKLEAELHALRGEDDFAGGLPEVGSYPEFENRDLSWFEMDLRDWGFVYGLAFGLAMRDNPELSHADAARIAFRPARTVFVAWSGAIDNPAEKREQAIRTLVGLFEVGERDAYKALVQANSGNGHLEMTEKLRDASHDLAQSARGCTDDHFYNRVNQGDGRGHAPSDQAGAVADGHRRDRRGVRRRGVGLPAGQ